MSSVIFKVVLKGNEQNEGSNTDSLTLTFKSILSSNIIKIPSHYISSLKSMSEHNEKIVSFQNLKEVIIIGELAKEYIINYYIVILYSMKSEDVKSGFLIANIKKVGDGLIGVWPFNEETEHLNENYINQKFNDFINHHDKYKNLVIINPN